MFVMAEGTYGQWTLKSGPTVVGFIDVRDGDFPWLSGAWTPTAFFCEVAPLFREELALMNELDDSVETWEAAYEKIREAVTLHCPDGREVSEFLLHIDGEEAWFRWSDDPFT